MQDCIFNPPDCRAAEDILVELQIEERRTAERTRALSETIAALRCTEKELSQELHELSVLLTLAQACPGKRPLERPEQGIVAQPQGQISPSITALFVSPPCQHEVDRATREPSHGTSGEPGSSKRGTGTGATEAGKRKLCILEARSDGSSTKNNRLLAPAEGPVDAACREEHSSQEHLQPPHTSDRHQKRPTYRAFRASRRALTSGQGQMDTSTYLNSPIQTTPDLLPDLGTLHHEPMPDTSPLETLTRQQKRNLRNHQKGLARRDLQIAASFLQPAM